MSNFEYEYEKDKQYLKDYLIKKKSSAKSKSKYKRVCLSPLRYAGGKSKAVGLILENLPKLKEKKIVSPFFGGGSFELALTKELGYEVIGYDIFGMLVNFWNILVEQQDDFVKELKNLKAIKEDFTRNRHILLEYWNLIKPEDLNYKTKKVVPLTDKEKKLLINNKLLQAVYYYYNMQLSYGPMFLGWPSSNEINPKKYKRRLDKLKIFNAGNLKVFEEDFKSVIVKHSNDFLFLDPPYYLGEKSKMFKGMYPNCNFAIHHNKFEHESMRDLLKKHKGGFLITYNNCPTIKEWYKEYKQVYPEWQYTYGQGETRIGDNRKEGRNDNKKESHEIFIICPPIEEENEEEQEEQEEENEEEEQEEEQQEEEENENENEEEKLINRYIISDNIVILKKINDSSIDMIYFDPPYNTGRDFSDYKDKYGKDEYITMLTNVIKECYRILKKRGNIIIHVESRISHFIRNILDDVFGYRKYKNTIIWKTGGNAKNKYQLGRMHDVLIVYGKSGKNKTKFNSIYIPYGDNYRKKNCVKMCPVHKKEYVTTVAHNSQANVNPRQNLRYEWKENHKQWYWTKEKMEKLDADNRLQYNQKNIPRIKRFLDEMDGIPITDLWTDISNTQNKEKLKYATQKPVKLLDRIIKMYSDEDDLVLDPFAGSGTLGRSAITNNRKYILIDQNEKGKEIFEKSIYKKN